eukprot:scaffold689_cov375-Prasinococcus_capsulatus_cf.AAC.2
MTNNNAAAATAAAAAEVVAGPDAARARRNGRGERREGEGRVRRCDAGGRDTLSPPPRTRRVACTSFARAGGWSRHSRRARTRRGRQAAAATMASNQTLPAKEQGLFKQIVVRAARQLCRTICLHRGRRPPRLPIRTKRTLRAPSRTL